MKVFVILNPATGSYWNGHGWTRETKDIKMFGMRYRAEHAKSKIPGDFTLSITKAECTGTLTPDGIKVQCKPID